VGPDLTEILHAQFIGGRHPGLNTVQAAKALIAQVGALRPQKLSAAHAIEADETIRRSTYTAGTKHARANATRQILRWLWENHGAPKLDAHIRKYPSPRPRNVRVHDLERAKMLAAAPPHLRLWLLLCSDLAVRSGTALKLNPQNYDPEARLLTFTTKCDEHLTLPATDEIIELLALCDPADPESFVRQLWRKHHAATRSNGRPTTLHPASLNRAFRRLRALCTSRHIVPHDLRRTTAVAMLRATHDLRDVQAILGHKNLTSTMWYLDHELRPVKRSTLELIKRPDWRKENIA
jgi:integrase/recombinase XerC